VSFYFFDLDSKWFQKAMSLWMHDPATRDAKIVRKALRPGVADNQALTETICSRTPSQIRRLKEVYQSIYHSPLETDIEIQLSGDHKKVFYLSQTPLIFLEHFFFSCSLSLYIYIYIQGLNTY